jgi:cell shape-determining protein MreD
VRRKLLEAIPAGSKADDRLARYQAAVITSLALIEGPGLLIIVLSLVSNAPRWIPAGTAVTLLMMVLARPRREELGTAD